MKLPSPDLAEPAPHNMAVLMRYWTDAGVSRRRRKRTLARQIGPLLGVAAIVGASLTLIVSRFNDVQFYIPPDAGHYLADADALFGQGVRENRHPPLFPFIVSIVRIVAHDDFVAVKLGIAAVVALATVCFYLFIRGRTGSLVGDLAASGLFALAPTTAEAVGWYGGSTLLGLALFLLTTRFIADLAARPSVWRSVLAATAVGGVVLTHPFSAFFLAVTSAAYFVFWLAVQVARASSLQSAFQPLRKLAASLSIVALGGLLGFVAARPFYVTVQSPYSIAPAFRQLELLWTWGFREDSVLWLSLLGMSILVAPLARWTAGERGLDLGLMVTAINVAIFSNLAFLSGDPGFATRSLYFAPVVIAAVFGVAITALINVVPHTRPRLNVVMSNVAGLAMVLVTVFAIQTFTYRLDVVMPYYNFVDQHEIAAIHYLAGRSGTVVLTPKGPDLDKGTQYAWIIEGLARQRALGSGTSAISLLAVEMHDTADAERFSAGPAVIENGQLRAAFDGSANLRVGVYGNVLGTWFHLLDIQPHTGGVTGPLATLAVRQGETSAEISGTAAAADPPATIRMDRGEHMVHVTMPATKLSPSGQLDITAAAGSYCSLDHCSDVARSRFQVSGSAIEWQTSLAERAVSITVSSADPASSSIQALVTPNGPALRSLDPSRPVSLQVNISGLTDGHDPVSTFTQAQLIHSQRIRYVWTWRSTQLVDELAVRSCFALAFENEEVAIFRVDKACPG